MMLVRRSLNTGLILTKPLISEHPYKVERSAEEEAVTGSAVEIVTRNGGTVNIRYGNGTEYGIIREAETGEKFAYVATAENG